MARTYAGVTPWTRSAMKSFMADYVKALQSAGFTNLSTNDYLAAKVQGVTPDFIQKARAHGFTNLTLRQLMALKMADVF
ncbi:MAG: hypothetical protein ACR2IV_15165 [Bryobacteraceae bacterium]